MANMTLQCEKNCNDNKRGFCFCLPARAYFSEIFDNNNIIDPDKRVITKHDNCEYLTMPWKE